MIQWILRKIIGTRNQRELKRIWPIVRKINQIEAGLQEQPDDALREKTLAGRRNWRGSTIQTTSPDGSRKSCLMRSRS